MRTYSEVFSELKSQNRTALIPFFVLGDPDFETSLNLIEAAIDAGADVLELGVPFSDPIADGPTIQKADIRAVQHGMNVHKALELIGRIKQYKDIPIGLLMYYNLICHYGPEKFFKDFHDAGVNSVLIADMTIDDADEVLGPITKAGLDTVFMVTPNTTAERIKQIASKTTGFIYTVSVLGVTGSRDTLSASVESLVGRLKSLADIPVCVGFGISKPEHARAVARAGADGVIIGSRIVGIIEANLDHPEQAKADISGFLTEVKTALTPS